MEPKGPIYRKGQTGGNENDQNTVTLEKNKEMPAEQVPTVAISLDVSALKIPEGQKVFVRHVKENGEVYYYAADIGKGFEIAIIAIAALLGLGVTAYMKKKQN